MESLDLSKHPPRKPRELLPGLDLLMAARTIDKLRATLPGGVSGAYHVRGFSQRLLETLGIPEDDARTAVANAGSDREIADWIVQHSDPATYAAINAALEAPTIGQRAGEAAFLEKYPLVSNLPPDTKLIDMLVIDDAAAFPSE